MRTEPPWSPPIARSTSPAANSAADPDDEPPALRLRSYGLRTGPLSAVWLPPEKHRLSHTHLPTIVAPASSTRSTTVASSSGRYPFSSTVPLLIGTPATAMLSLMAMVLPASGPPPAPSMRTRHAH